MRLEKGGRGLARRMTLSSVLCIFGFFGWWCPPGSSSRTAAFASRYFAALGNDFGGHLTDRLHVKRSGEGDCGGAQWSENGMTLLEFFEGPSVKGRVSGRSSGWRRCEHFSHQEHRK